ncbi:gamma-glutamylcyclotransferase [Photobacterium sp. SDRW27]|uniref:gamma-glutamylcyclotransferase family protein n=1 Tax=Photobacterium obscurum TaxID=2829490 RepID=UPI00224357CD|nr:gamma-glutamylcyclotransferase family protein [Photobacterium obscurum]MCW8330287.1 gamma-glutamylcyclotransferase [Photobacterium obscurum]
MVKVFVYGTLRAGQSNHHLLRQATRVGAYQLVYGYQLYDLGCYPAAKKSEAVNLPLVGEVYCIDDDTLAVLDRLEEYPEVYTRERIETHYGLAWVYLYRLSTDLLPLIPSGDWCQR